MINEESSQPGISKELTVRCLLTEYSSLRDSIVSLTAIKNALVAANITFVGVVLGLDLIEDITANKHTANSANCIQPLRNLFYGFAHSYREERTFHSNHNCAAITNCLR